MTESSATQGSSEQADAQFAIDLVYPGTITFRNPPINMFEDHHRRTSEESVCSSAHQDEIRAAERELSAFIGAVTQLFGPEEAKLSAQDWIDEWELMDSPAPHTCRDLREVTIAASARLANRRPVAIRFSRDC